MTDDNLLPFCFPAVRRKKITAAFDGGRISSDGGVMLLAQADRRLGIAERLARAIPDGRDPDRVTHLLPDILRARIFAIACGYEDADDLDRLRFDPAFKLACGRLPDSGRDLCSQPTVSRWENAPDLRDLIRLMGRDGRSLLRQLHQAARGGDARHRRHGGCRSRPSAALAVQRPLRRRAGRSPCCCVPARHPRAPRSAVTCAVSSVASGGTGRRPASPSGATVITAARRSWSGATRTTSTLSLVCPATRCSTGWSMRRPTTFAPAARSTRSRACAASPRQATGRNPGTPIAVPVPGSRLPPRASTSASSSPAWRPDRQSIFTRRSTVPEARPRT